MHKCLWAADVLLVFFFLTGFRILCGSAAVATKAGAGENRVVGDTFPSGIRYCAAMSTGRDLFFAIYGDFEQKSRIYPKDD